MNKVDKYIGQAICQISKNQNMKSSNGGISKVYNGYIASMGASIIQSGLLPTLAFFEEKERDNTKGNKAEISKIILSILNEHNKDKEYKVENNSLLKYVLINKDHIESIKKQIIDINIALKLAIRTFELVEPDKK